MNNDEAKKQTSKKSIRLARNTWAIHADLESLEKLAKRREISEYIIIVLILLAFVLYFIPDEDLKDNDKGITNIIVIFLMAVTYVVGIGVEKSVPRHFETPVESCKNTCNYNALRHSVYIRYRLQAKRW